MDNSSNATLSVIIPIYNEVDNIQVLYDRLDVSLAKFAGRREFIFINDGSYDDSLFLIKRLSEQQSDVKYISFSRNFGHQIAVMAGLDASNGGLIAIIDADLQDPPELIYEMANVMDTGYDVVYAKRKTRKKEGFFKKITAKLFYRILSMLTDISIPLDTGDFRLINRKVVEILKKMPEQQKFLRGQISWIGFKQTFITYDRDERHGGKTGYSLGKMVQFALDGLTSFSNIPLRLSTYLGFFVSLLSFFLMGFALYSRLFSKNYVDGWASIIIAISFIGGVQLICLGIIGEYLGRIAINIRDRPLYIVDETNFDLKNKV